jgi:2-hydroxymuconate-semialdehyde hydrolase
MTATSAEIGKTLRLDGLEINYHDVGDREPLLLIHGSGPGVSAWANWRGVIPELSRHFRVIAPDMAGFGYTKVAEGHVFNVDTWIAQVVSLMDALGIAKAHVLGNSFGGGIALHFARRHPKRVDKLVLMGAVSVSFSITPALDLVWGYTPSMDNMRRMMDVFAWDRSMMTEDLIKLRYEASTQRGMDKVYESLFPAPRQRWVDMLAQPEAELAQIPHHTLILHGRDDQVIPPAASIRLASVLKHADLSIFAHCGHWTQIEQREAFLHAVTGFLSRSTSER